MSPFSILDFNYSVNSVQSQIQNPHQYNIYSALAMHVLLHPAALRNASPASTLEKSPDWHCKNWSRQANYLEEILLQNLIS